jgi:hypothetical protein
MIKTALGRVLDASKYSYAVLWNKLYWAQYHFRMWQVRHKSYVLYFMVTTYIWLSTLLHPYIQAYSETAFSDAKSLSDLRTLLVVLGGALVGAAVMAFSVVMFAMQINIERMPYGLFRKFSNDLRLMSAFGGTFMIAISIACVSLIPDKSWAGSAILFLGWGVVLIFSLSIYAYRRALLLINPVQQLNILLETARRHLLSCKVRAIRAEPIFNRAIPANKNGTDLIEKEKHDFLRMAYFKANPGWDKEAKRQINHAISFSRRYAEQGDHEISGAALKTVVDINKTYIDTKGKTFFANQILFDAQLSTDSFINETLEHLRQNIRIATSNKDEQQIEQTFRALLALTHIYIGIDYSSELASKTHAFLAAGYLSEAVQTVIPLNMPDVLMEGMRLMGQCAQLFLIYDKPESITDLTDKIGVIGAACAANKNFHPVTLIAMEQLADLTYNLMRTRKRNGSFAQREIRKNIGLIVKTFLSFPDTPLASTHSTYLGPYYSGIRFPSLQSKLTELANVLIEAQKDDRDAQAVIHNIKEWSDELYKFEKEILLTSLERKSGFTFDVVHWISHIAKILLALSNAPACSDHDKEKLQENALWLISTLSWIPDDKETISFVESYQITETLFESCCEAQQRDCPEVTEEIEKLLLNWGFKAGQHQTGWATLERTIYALSTLAIQSDQKYIAQKNLKDGVTACLLQKNVPERDILDRAARNIREKMASFNSGGFHTSAIEHGMSQVDPVQLKVLLNEIANLLSPHTAGEKVRRRIMF